jgi:pilus assembly protein CpaE
MPPKFCLYYHSQENGEYLQKLINASPQCQLLESKILEELPGQVNSGTDVVFLEYQEDNPGLDRWIEKVASDHRSPPIFLYLKEISTDNLWKALRLGVKECFAYPIQAEEFQAALHRLPRRAAQAAGTGKSRLISFLGSKGGVGNSFLTANVAALLAQEQQGPVLAVDLDLHYGQLAHFFEARPRYTILEVVENLERLDSSYLQSLLHPVNEHLSLLPAPARLEEAEMVTPAHLEKILRYLKNLQGWRWVLLDCCHLVNEVILKALEISEELLLILTPSIPALANAKKLLEVLSLLGLEGLEVQLWLNCWQKQGDLSLKEIAKFLGREVSGTVEFAPDAVGRSINEGKPLVQTAPNHPVCRDLRRLVSSIVGTDLKAAQGSGRGWLRYLRRRA